MKFQIRGKNIPVTNSLKEYVEKRLGKLDKYFENNPEAIVTLVIEKEQHRVEVTIPINGLILRGEEESIDMYSSIDLVVEKLEKQINKYKTRLSKKVKAVSIKDIAPDPCGEKISEDEAPKVLRTKRFAIKPMPVDEAILQMNLLGHSFFVFSNAETEEVNVVYKRKDGNYGLIEPEF
ncbi:MAG: ribosome hibernation-promoting factor, HPF/YfiA family [Bacillota bacterium]|uniref:Ribosome hibernation promoting factor n=1 Tax=Thermanaerosceptrum fracticalcis TaxID=1712410 RepID=A0A7G6E489_THEFR|nr:ribosome-associated translation inhibitor RaiA [Thermanaerosceptrum fracticalcis]QNB46893.1 ribosome-associated translation inhibitor RaiA [Thermanaerosceptrum fracticalcis]